MPSTMTQTCALCGLRYANSALLELHIREDYVQRNQQAAPAHGDAAVGTASQARARTSRSGGQAPRLPHPLIKVTAGTATTRPRRLAGPATAALRRLARSTSQAGQAVRYVNEELLRASEAISLRRVPQARWPRQTRTDSNARLNSQSTKPSRRAA